MKSKKVMMVGSAEKSNGGVASAIKVIKKMSCWKEFSCYWLGTQIQGKYLLKLKYCISAYIISLFKIWKYNIIHFHTVPDRICLIIQLPVFLLALLGKKKIIMHIHMGNQLEEHTNNALFIWCLKHSNLIILLAKKWEYKFKEWYPNISTPTTTLYNAYEPVEAIPYKNRDKTILLAANLNENKGYGILLKAFQRIHHDFPDWKVIILGDGEIEKAKKMAHEFGIQDKTIFTGYLTGEEKIKYFQKASIYCMSSYQEGFPMVVLEAWSYGIPVVTTPVGGLPDVIEEEKNACVFNFGDDIMLAQKLQNLICNPLQRETMSIYSIKYVNEHFSIMKTDEQLHNIYINI